MTSFEQQLFESLRAPVIVSGQFKDLPVHIKISDTLAVLHPESAATRRGNTIYLLDGVGIAGSTAIIDSAGVADLLSPRHEQESPQSVAERWGKGIKNPCAAFVIDLQRRDVMCLPDPLGGALAFRYLSGSVQVISTDTVSLAAVVRAMNLPLHKSADFQLERLVLGNGGLVPSSYQDVDRLDPFEYWHVFGDGVKRKRYSRDDSEPTYVRSVELIRDELIESVLAVSKLPTERRIAHITGGFDSRLVLAAAMASGCEKEFLYFCSGPPGSTDRIIADGLTLTLGLPRSAGGGLAGSPVSHVHEQLLAPLYHSGGITSSGPNGGEKRSDAVVVGGGYGGILRSTFSSRFTSLLPEDVSPATLMEKLAPRPAGNVQVYAQEALSSLGHKLWQEWQRLLGQGHPHDSVGDALYLAVRNRYHFGQNSMLWSRVGRRFDPLYSVSAATAASRLPLYSRQTNVLGFDVMTSFGVDLEKYPFDKNRFTTAYKTLRREPRNLDFTGSGPIQFDDAHRPTYTGKSPLPAALDALAVTTPQLTGDERQAVIEKANKIGLNYWQIATMKSAQKSLRTALNEFGLTTIDGLVNTEYAWHLGKGRLTQRAEIRDLYSLYGLVAWLGTDA